MPCPVYPKPLKDKASIFKLFFRKRRSWLEALYERSYKMKMGQVNIPGNRIYMINQPDLVQRVMIEEAAEFPKHKLMGDIMSPLMGESIFTTNGRQWKKQRDMLNPSFDMVRVQHVFGLMQDAADAMLKRLAGREATEIDMDAEMTYVTADIIFRTILSVSIEEKEARQIFDAFAIFQEETPKATLKRIFHLPSWFGGGEKRRIASGREIRDTLARIIRPRYDAGGGEEKDILSSILATIDEDKGQRFSFDEIVDQVAMLFLAGHETSAAALTWSLYLLALHPDIQEQAAAEVKNIAVDGNIDIAAVRQMDLVRDVFREALRLYPPVGFFARECTVSTQMRDKQVEKGSSIVIAPWLIQRHRDYWDRPDDFDPYRYAKDKMKVPLRDAFLPFGMGPRVCIGTAFAMQEGVLILATLLQKYKMALAPGFTPQPVGRLTVRSENGMQMILTKRNIG
jgi:cytochrome P450